MTEGRLSPSRLPVPARPSREIDAYAGTGGAGGVEPPTVNVLAAVWRRRGWVLACVVLALAAGAVYLARAVQFYSSTSVIYVQQAAPKFVSDEISSSMGSAGYLFTQCQLITSTAILSRAVEEPGVADAPLLRGMENPVGYLKSAVTAAPSKQGELIIVGMESTSPADSATIVNGVVQAYIEYQSRQHQSDAFKVAGILQKEIHDHEADLRTEQARMLQLRKDNPGLTAGLEKGAQTVDRLSQLTGALTEAQFRADDLRAGVAAATAADPSDLSTLRGIVDQYKLADQLPGSTLPELAQLYEQDRLRLADLRDRGFGVADEQVRTVQKALDRAGSELVAARGQAAAACVSTVRNASAVADARVKQLDGALTKERADTMGLNAQEAEFAELSHEAARNETALDSLDERFKSIEGTIDVSPLTVNVLETAKPDRTPVRPVRSKVLGEAVVAGLMAGLGLAMLLDKVDQRIRSIEEISSLLETPILGVIPRIVRRVLPGEAGREIELRPRSGVAEAFRTVRTAIYFGGEERAAKTILVTSPTPGDGKSTTISNLAIAVSQAGRRVLLIDADCRRPVQHKTFKVDETPGLTGILTGRSTLADAVRPTGIDRLDLLQCGPLPHNPAELLDSQALLDLLAEAGRQYDQVLIDSPPVTLVSDARVLAASCDAAVLVLRAERSTRRGAQLAWNALASVGANLLGVVVNDLARPSGGYGYGYAYYGYGRYGYAPAELNGNGHANGTNGNGQSAPALTAAPPPED